MSNIAIRENVAWIYFARCFPKNLIQFPLSLYLYVGQTLYPDDRPAQHMTEEKSNQKFALLRSLTSPNDWKFVFFPIIPRDNESRENYMNRVGIFEKEAIRELGTNYLKNGFESYGLNASDGGEHPANGGLKTSIPGETTGIKYVYYHKPGKTYRYKRNIWKNNQHIGTKEIYHNRNPFLLYLYMEKVGEKDIIVDEEKFWNKVLQWWNVDIYNTKYVHDYLGIKNVSIAKHKTAARGYGIYYQKKVEGKTVYRSRVLFSDFLKLYQDGILDKGDIFCLDFYVWNAKLVLEGKFDIENSRPDVFYDDFLEFRKIRHFDVDDLGPAISFLKEMEHMSDISIPVGQQRLQLN